MCCLICESNHHTYDSPHDFMRCIQQTGIQHRNVTGSQTLRYQYEEHEQAHRDTASWATSSGHVNMYSEHTSGWSETSTDEEEDVNITAASPSTPPLVEESLATTAPEYMSRIQCHKCDKMSHFARHCNVGSEPSTTQIPPVPESVALIPPSVEETSSAQHNMNRLDNIQCYNCMQFGHYARFCPLSPWDDAERRLFSLFPTRTNRRSLQRARATEHNLMHSAVRPLRNPDPTTSLYK
jgi:hypothetical protein